MEQLARTPALVLPIVIATASAASGRSAVNGGLPPIPGSFRSVSAGECVKVAGMGSLCANQTTTLSLDAATLEGDGLFFGNSSCNH